MKKNYQEPKVSVLAITDDLMDVIPPAGSPGDDFSKENNVNFEEENTENDPRPKNLWEE